MDRDELQYLLRKTLSTFLARVLECVSKLVENLIDSVPVPRALVNSPVCVTLQGGRGDLVMYQMRQIVVTIEIPVVRDE